MQKTSKPIQLFDNHGRPINYVRLAVTDRCNLRCFYCMPEAGLDWLPRKELLSFEEIVRLLTLLSNMGITKVRLTGGEPFLRKDLMQLIRRITELPVELHLTTNGVLTAPVVPELKELGVGSVNLSLDTLDRERFARISFRNVFAQVWNTFEALIDAGIPVKINCVVMEGKNTEDILPMVNLTKDYPISVRFIEEMPFNGTGNHYPELHWTYKKIKRHIEAQFSLEPLPSSPNATAETFHISGHAGNVGIIAAYSRTFCGTCNRIRITAQGTLKTCLYDNGVLDIKQLLRSSASDEVIEAQLMEAFRNRARNGFEAEQRRVNNPVTESMSTIGG